MRDSSYYPPRVHDRWLPSNLARIFDRSAVRANLWFSHFRPPFLGESIPAVQWLLALLVPGWGYAVGDRPRIAWTMSAGWAASLLLFVVFLGHPWVTGWALGGMASAHSSGLGFLILHERELNAGQSRPGLIAQITISLSLWGAYLVLIYLPFSSAFQRHIAHPIPFNNRIAIANPGIDLKGFKPGDQVAIRIGRRFVDGILVEAGVTWGTYLAGPGSQLEFTAENLRVNGQMRARLPQMPTSGQLTINRRTHFIWPRLNERIVVSNSVSLEPVYLNLAQVSEENLVGRPFRRWFFWRQDFL